MGHSGTYFFPFRAGREQRNHSVGDSGPPRNDRRVVDKLVGAELEQKQSADEGGDIVRNDIAVDHASGVNRALR